MTVPALTLSLSQETAMPNVKTGERKKIIKKKKYLQIINVLKKSIRAITIIKHILNLRIN